jgi:ApaG protein
MPSSIASVRMYRVLQRHCRTQFPKGPTKASFVLQPPLDPIQAGSSRVTNIPVADGSAELLKWLNHQLDDPDYEAWIDLHTGCVDGTSEGEGGGDTNAVNWVVWTTAEALRNAIRFAFRPQRHAETIIGGRLEWAIRAYQVLLEQSNLLKSFSYREERGMRIAATSQFVGKSSSNKRRFAYRIRIENVDAPEFQLLGRSWIIQDDPPSSTDTVRVHDPMGGAVGQFPVLQRGQAFEYMSGCEIASPTGVMKGCFHFRDSVDDALFEVPVEPFLLRSSVPNAEPRAGETSESGVLAGKN